MKAYFRVLTTKWVLKSSSCFCLAKKKIDKADQVCPYLPALWLRHQPCFLKTLDKWKDLPLFLTFIGKNVGDNRLWSQVISTFEGRFAPPWTVKNLSQLVSIISPLLPRSRSCHLFGTMFVYGRIDSINKKMGEIYRSKEKVINLWWLSYIWD